VSCVCSLASAGHPPPVVLLGDGTVEKVDLVPGPALGTGGFPFETTAIDLPEGSLLALYTDGLIATREHDARAGVDALAHALAGAVPSLEATCDAVLASPSLGWSNDDVALVIARTRALSGSQVAAWALPADPEVVAQARAEAARQLSHWGLDDLAFVTELTVSELVTNAIRYGQPPISLRLIRDRALICEVSDGSGAAPHLRRARSFDEGGRGLHMVAQFCSKWGTRHTATGKTIWAEQPLQPVDV
jgi:anti-sigma regulatory factor (Ser/Thr protein kinase)